MELSSYADPVRFLRQARAYLERNEAATALILGTASRLAQRGGETDPYLAVVGSGAEIALVAMLTPPHRLVLWAERPASDAATHVLAVDLHANGWSVPGALGPPRIVEPWLAEWQKLTQRPWRLAMHERIYELTAVTPPPPVAGYLRAAGPADYALAVRWIDGFHREALGVSDPVQAQMIAESKIAESSLYLWDDAGAVAMAGHGRGTMRSSTISLVYTPPEWRRRGYAMACVAALSQRLLDGGKEFCTLFTDLANPTSNSIYQQIGYRPVCDFNAYDIDIA